MAFTRQPTYCLTLSFIDRDKNKGSTEFFVDTVNTVLEIITALEATIIPAVQALSDAVITGWSINSTSTDLAPAVPAETSDVERKGVFVFQAANGASYTLQIPSIKNTLVIDGTNVIDQANAAVTTFVDMVVSDVLLALVRPRTYLGSDIARLFSTPNKKHRKSGKG
jgi:hypothetical protein